MVALTGDGPHRHLGADPGQASPAAAGVPGTTRRRWNPTATTRGPRPRTDRAAPTRCSSALTTSVQIAVTRPADAPVTTAATGLDTGERPRLRPGQRRTAAGAEPFRGADHPAAGARRHPVDAAGRGAGPGAAAQHHHPRPVGCRRGDEMRRPPSTTTGLRAAVVHHTAGQQRLRPRGFRGDRAGDLRLPHPHPGLVRHRLQRPGRQVRSGLRRPRRRHRQAGRGFPHRRVQPQHVGCGDARRLRRRTADRDPAAHRRPAAGLATGPRPRRPAGHRRSGVVRAVPTRTSRGRRRHHSADDLHPPRRRQHRLPGQCRLCRDGRDPGHRRTFQRPARPATLEDSAAGRRDLRQVGGPGRRTAAARRNPRPPRRPADGDARYVTFDSGAIYWSPDQRRRTAHRCDLRRVGSRWVTSAACSDCRPAARSRNRSGWCRTSSTAP